MHFKDNNIVFHSTIPHPAAQKYVDDSMVNEPAQKIEDPEVIDPNSDDHLSVTVVATPYG